MLCDTLDFPAQQKNYLDRLPVIRLDDIDVICEQGVLKFRDKTDFSFHHSPAVALMNFVRENGIRPGTPINGKKHLFFIQGSQVIDKILKIIEEKNAVFHQKVLVALETEQSSNFSQWW